MKKYALSLLAVIVAVAAGYWLVITPDNPLTRAFQRKISDIDSRIIVGPYPNKSDFRLLRDHQVNLIVSLLDPRLPYENTLLEEERKIAQQYGIRLLNFPMASIIGYKFGENYENNAIAAADVIANTSEKVYLHCYLGMHRIQVVRDILNTRGIPAGTYTIRHGEREMSRRLLDAADIDYHAGRYEESLNTLAKIAENEKTPDASILQGWSHYRLGRRQEARIIFDTILKKTPDNTSALLGAGYSSLNTGDVSMAEHYFSLAIQLEPHNGEALGGLGLVNHRVGRLDKAANYLDEALRYSPENQDFRTVLELIRK